MDMRKIVTVSFDEAVKELGKSQKAYYACLIAMIVYILVSIYLVIIYADTVLFMFMTVIFILPALPLIAYFFLELSLYAFLSMARERLDKAKENYSYWESYKRHY
ncbi:MULTISPECIES: hypothetical protein [unclassified Streptococcus]|uniref:hypothetical protein n=1 Tax=unclassified Streptococcus TaxID=2608887 RepID=UPI00211AEE19|nr:MULTISPECIES: hypothetical protein [unclassified Streptococcus]MCQ9211816.1 hypothetical protein [Streptococcus sp. B01]MCQ9212846.1 hypothetical protein [Streptococcus sp. B01]MCQ9212935.1 hypothetical protein [Streptococcus sp. O1]MCQ9215013.1 hypothetical protein [Streptococcus sp. O1]